MVAAIAVIRYPALDGMRARAPLRRGWSPELRVAVRVVLGKYWSVELLLNKPSG
jgi:hypothetical protein